MKVQKGCSICIFYLAVPDKNKKINYSISSPVYTKSIGQSVNPRINPPKNYGQLPRHPGTRRKFLESLEVAACVRTFDLLLSSIKKNSRVIILHSRRLSQLNPYAIIPQPQNLFAVKVKPPLWAKPSTRHLPPYIYLYWRVNQNLHDSPPRSKQLLFRGSIPPSSTESVIHYYNDLLLRSAGRRITYKTSSRRAGRTSTIGVTWCRFDW